jgi:hypothetical protein
MSEDVAKASILMNDYTMVDELTNELENLAGIYHALRSHMI